VNFTNNTTRLPLRRPRRNHGVREPWWSGNIPAGLATRSGQEAQAGRTAGQSRILPAIFVAISPSIAGGSFRPADIPGKPTTHV